MKFFTLSFDDGTRQDVRLVELLNGYGLKCTFNLNSGLFGTKHRIVHEGIDVDHSEITADMVHDLYLGHEVAVHTKTHPRLDMCGRERIIDEVCGDKAALEALVGYEIVGMAYPGGPFYNDEVISIITGSSSIRYARTTNSHRTFALPERLMTWHPTCHQNDERLFELADKFIKADAGGDDLLFYLWGHSFEFDKFKSWDSFERFCSLISGHTDIKYLTNAEVTSFIK